MQIIERAMQISMVSTKVNISTFSIIWTVVVFYTEKLQTQCPLWKSSYYKYSNLIHLHSTLKDKTPNKLKNHEDINTPEDTVQQMNYKVIFFMRGEDMSRI